MRNQLLLEPVILVKNSKMLGKVNDFHDPFFELS